MFEFLRRVMVMHNAPLELTSFYGLSAPNPVLQRKREKKVKELTMQMGNKHRLAVSVRK